MGSYEKEQDSLNKIRSIYSKYCVVPSIQRRGPVIELCVASKGIRYMFEQVEIMKKAHEKSIPEIIMKSPRSVQCAYQEKTFLSVMSTK